MQLSIVVPVYKSVECLPELVRRVNERLSRFFDSHELILVNDGSPDGSWDTIAKVAREQEFVTGVNLRRNVGQDNAIMAGFSVARGEVIVIMDDDLQHDPSDIPALYDTVQKGFDVVYAHFQHKRQALWKNLGSWFNDRCAVMILGKPKHVYMSPFKAIRREIMDELIKYSGPYPYVDGLIFAVTSNITQVHVPHYPRFAGKSNYNLLRSVRVWLKLATSFSVLPLRIATFVGGVISIVSFAMALYFVLEALFVAREPEGWPSVIVAVLFIGGIQLLGIGALGEYIGRIFITQNQRPQFIIKEISRPIDPAADSAIEPRQPADMNSAARKTEIRSAKSR